MLNPRPRNFVDELLRYVSATNFLATDDDLRITIRNGLGGSSMPGFPKLANSDIDALIAITRQFQRTGLSRQYRKWAQQHSVDDEVSLQPMNNWIQARLEPQGTLQVPEAVKGSQLSQATGREVFLRAGCASCHAVREAPAIVAVPLFDSLAQPIKPRHFGRDPLRRGSSLTELYRRISLGMPGTPHPAASLTEPDIDALIHYVQDVASQSIPSTNFTRWVWFH